MTIYIGTANESSLHRALKQLYSHPGDLIEAKVVNSIIDIVRGELLIEIQTGNFSALKEKLNSYLAYRPVQIVYPISICTNILRIANDGRVISSRKSPKKGKVEDIFRELVSIAGYVKHPNFSLEVAFVEEETIWFNDGKGSWRRNGWSITDRRLTKLHGCRTFLRPRDYADLLPQSLKNPFTSIDLARESGLRKNLAGKMIYCLRSMGEIRMIGKKGRSYLYERS